MAEAKVDDTIIHLTCNCGDEISIPVPLSLQVRVEEGSNIVHLGLEIGNVDMKAAHIHEIEKHMGLGDLNWEVDE